MTSERGSAALEFAVIVPALGVLLALLIGAGRVWFARANAEQIASIAARAASQAVTPAQARSDAEHIARAQAATTGLNCSSLDVVTDVSGFQVPVGQPASVNVRVDCAVPLADLLMPGWPGQWQVTASGSSVLDRYRKRG